MKVLLQVLKNPGFTISFVVITILILTGIIGPNFLDRTDAMLMGKYGTNLIPGTIVGAHKLILGSDAQGHDVLVRLIFGLKSSLYVGLAAGIVATLLGTIIGLTAGYKGGWIDNVLSSTTNLFIVIPAFIIIILVSAILNQRSLTLVAILIGMISWSWTAVAVRAQAASLRERDHVALAKLNGFGTISIIFRQIMPYIMSYIFMCFIIQMSTGILNEAAISMIGLGPYDTVTLGVILNDAQHGEAIISGYWWIFFPATIIITLLQFCLYVMNTALESVFNPRLRQS